MSNLKENTKNQNITLRDVALKNRGGKDAIERMLIAYGFDTKISLCHHLGISQSSLANRYLRDTFPAEWILVCSYETGASLEWLATGQGNPRLNAQSNSQITCHLFELENGELNSLNEISLSKEILPQSFSKGFGVKVEQSFFMVDNSVNTLSDGLWVIEIDGLISIREVIRLPGNRIKVGNNRSSFECGVEDVKPIGKVVSQTTYMN